MHCSAYALPVIAPAVGLVSCTRPDLASAAIRHGRGDPLTSQFRSWVFDSDGGYGDGYWVGVGDAWVAKSTSVLPDGETGSATFYLTPEGDDKFVWKSVDRIRAGEYQPDATLTFVRKPPAPKRN